MRNLVAAIALLAAVGSAAAAPPSSCASKFVGIWRHNGIGGITNKATLTADGTAACSENSACVQGTWTCEGNVLKYFNGMYSTDYTLQPSGIMTARGGITVTRLGRGPAGTVTKTVSGTASNVTADVLGIDKTYTVAAPKSETKSEPKASSQPVGRSEEQVQAEGLARELFDRGKIMAREASREYAEKNWSTAEDRFSESAVQFRKAGDLKNEKIALDNQRIAKANRLRAEQAALYPQRSVRTTRYSKYSLRCKVLLDRIKIVEDAGANQTSERAGLKAQGCE